MKERFTVLESSNRISTRIKSVFALAMEITKADLKARQFQRLLGPLWWILEPALMSFGYYFLTSRLSYNTGDLHFLFIFISTTVWRSFSKCIEVSLMAYVSHGAVIRQTSFPLLAVNLANLMTELFFFLLGFGFIFLFLLMQVTPGFAILFLPMLILCQFVVTFGICVLLSCTGVYFRDIAGLMGLGLNLLFLASPGIYDVDKLPAIIQKVSIVNPFYFLFPAYRDVLLHDRLPSLTTWSAWMAVGILLSFVSIRIYRNVRPRFLRVL